MNKQDIALHLIKQDLKYHQLVNHLAKVDFHLEYHPDLATAVQQLLCPDIDQKKEEKWINKYVRAMSRAKQLDWTDKDKLETHSRIILEILKP